jgi:hypothetical protein
MISTEVFTFAVSKYFKRLNLPMSHLSTSLIVSKFWNRERFQGIQCKCGKRAYYVDIQLEFESNEILYD